MKAIVFSALVAGLAASAAVASPLTLTRKTVDDGWAKGEMICDQFGRCWTVRNHNALLDSYN